MTAIRFFSIALLSLACLGHAAQAPKAAKAAKTPPPDKAPPLMTEAAALTLLKSDNVQDKARACQELALVGGKASVEPLAALLGDERLGDYARSGLESITDASAGKALLAALGRLNGRQLAGVVNSLGVRREKGAVGDLHKLALDPTRGVAPEAIASLGLIATPEAAKTLQKVLADGPAELRTEAAYASLVAAELFAKEKNPAAARALLDAITRAKPSEHLVKTAQQQAATLARR